MDILKYIDRLRDFVTPERYDLLCRKLGLRTSYIAVVLENVHHEQNISAVMRTCECLGIQNLYIIENSNRHSEHPTISRGADKWLTIHRFNQHDDNTPTCIEHLRSKGYRIVATTPHDDASLLPPMPGFGAGFSLPERSDSLYHFDITKGPVAIFIGSERVGISRHVVDAADDFITIPMVGFTESLNLSVTAAIVVAHLRRQLEQLPDDVRDSLPAKASLTTDERNEILVEWLLNSIRNADLVAQRIKQEIG